jgi:hypothetical protein
MLQLTFPESFSNINGCGHNMFNFMKYSWNVVFTYELFHLHV